MAEIILVLLFLLLMLLGSKIEKLSQELNTAFAEGTPEYESAAMMKDALTELKAKDIISPERDVEWLSERLVLAAEAAILSGANVSNEDLLSIQGMQDRLNSMLRENETLQVENSELASNLAKAENLQRQLSLDDELVGIVTDREISSSEIRQCLLNCGGGPNACWGQSLSNPDFIYNIALYDDFLIVAPDSLSVDKNIVDWNSLPKEARVNKPTVFSNAEFRTSFSVLNKHAVNRDCVFQTRVIDVNTANKEIYKRQKKLVDDYTYSTIFKKWDYGAMPAENLTGGK